MPTEINLTELARRWLGKPVEIELNKPRPVWALLRNLVFFFAALFVAGVVGELFPALKALDACSRIAAELVVIIHGR